MSTRDERLGQADPAEPAGDRGLPRRHLPDAVDDPHRTPIPDGRGSVGRRRDGTPDARVAEVKTSVAAAFALALGVGAFLLVATVVLAPIGALFGLLGLILGIVGIRAARKPARTGKGVAITGLVLSVIALMLVATAAIGVTTFLNDPAAVGQLQQQIEQLRGQAPNLPAVPGS